MEDDSLDFSEFGLVRRGDLAMSNAAITRALRSGRLARFFPEIYFTCDAAIDPAAAKRRAALLYAGPGAYLGCISSCAEWALPHDDARAVHLMEGPRRLRRTPVLIPHRCATMAPVARGDVLVSTLETSVVEAFGCLDRSAGRELVMRAIRERRVSADRLRAAIRPRCRSRPALLALLDDVAGGSHSEAELALIRLIRDAGLPDPKRQLRVAIGERSAYLDVAFEAQRVAVEADSRTWHFTPDARAADIRRDAWLGAAGWVVLRFLYEQIVGEPDWVAARIREALAVRQQDQVRTNVRGGRS
ncbi:MAG: DUF559 domain-containing protein [Mycobacteriales bacterium]